MEDNPEKYSFLLHMYDQMWNNINRHILTVWQSVAAIGASLSIIVFSGKSILSVDVAAFLITVLAYWLIAHVYDGQTWFDRNISIIQKIEKHFGLKPGEMHHHDNPRELKLITHLKIQRDLGIVVLVINLTYHFYNRIIPVCSGLNKFEAVMLLPYFALAIGLFYVFYVHNEWKKNYRKAFES